jgi:hypothetical protein
MTRCVIALALATAMFVVVGARARAADPPAHAECLAVVVSADLPIEDIDMTELVLVFTRQRRAAPGGRSWVPLNRPPGHPDRVRFDLAVLGMTPDVAGRYWIDQKIRGFGEPPRIVSSTQTLARLVARVPGTLAYLPLDQVGAGLRALRVDGRRCGETHYAVATRGDAGAP